MCWGLIHTEPAYRIVIRYYIQIKNWFICHDEIEPTFGEKRYWYTVTGWPLTWKSGKSQRKIVWWKGHGKVKEIHEKLLGKNEIVLQIS